MLILVIFSLLLPAAQGQAATALVDELLTTSDCRREKGCWFMPTGCEEQNVDDCYAIIKWTTTDQTLTLQMLGQISDIQKVNYYPHINTGTWIAVGFSHDYFMGDDLVIDCTHNPSRALPVSAHVNFNDGTHPIRLFNATSMLLADLTGAVVDDKLVCQLNYQFDKAADVRYDDARFLKDLRRGRYNLLMARGAANPNTDAMSIHPTTDYLYPFISSEQIVLSVASNNAPFVGEMFQSDRASRYVKYRLAGTHAFVMVFAWWVLQATAMIMARFFKPFWPTKKLFGTAVWFQAHRNLSVMSVLLQVGAFIIIFVCAGRFLVCNTTCDESSYNLMLHALCGTTATGLALIQPFLAWARPGPGGSWRRQFNWLHWLIGNAAFVFASVTIFLGIPLGKTGVLRNTFEHGWGYIAYWVCGVYIASYMVVNIVMEYLTSGRRDATPDESEMRLTALNGPSPPAKSGSAGAHCCLLVVFVVVALGTAGAMTYFIVLNWH